jgi:putative DNA primase/helicase
MTMTPEAAARIVAMFPNEGSGFLSPQSQDAEEGLDASDDGDVRPSDSGSEPVDAEKIKACAALDHSDTDNGKRLLRHFGADLCALEIAEAKSPYFGVWRETHWDFDNGAMLAHQIGQKVGARIGLEADFLENTPSELKIIAAAEAAEGRLAALERGDPKKWSAEKDQLREAIGKGAAARAALQKRKTARLKFAVSSKNKSRIDAMLHCAGACICAPPDAFNPDPYRVATKTHTLRFIRERADECPDPEVCRWTARVEATPGHFREDKITRIVPHPYDPDARCDTWLAFLEEFLPDRAAREFVQTFSGLGLLGRTVQKLVFHYGTGANAKSVFLETLMRVLGPLAVGLPAESITGHGERAAGGASPDLARLYGARAVRILELPVNKPLHEDLVKKLTGGEKIPVRTLFKGYFEFTPVFTCHMSGNGYPRIDGTDNGIWRRMAVVHWPVSSSQRATARIRGCFGALCAGISGRFELVDIWRAALHRERAPGAAACCRCDSTIPG